MSIDGTIHDRKLSTTTPHGASPSFLDMLDSRVKDGRYIATADLRDSLRRAAALFCRTKNEHPRVLRQLVGIPFRIFTKQSIRLGVSIWLNIMSEDPSTEQQILALVAEGWEKSIHREVGAFSPKLL